MWIFVFLLFTLGFFITLIKLSLAVKFRTGIVLAFFAAVLPLSFFPLAVRVNTAIITALLGDYGVTSSLCTFFICEAVILMCLFPALFQEKSFARMGRIKKLLFLFPSPGFILGLAVIQILLYNYMNGRSFVVIAFAYSILVFFSFCVGLITFHYVVRREYIRLEILLSLVFFELVFSMFLPMIATGLEVPKSHFTIDPFSIFVTITSAVFLFICGYMLPGFIKPKSCTSENEKDNFSFYIKALCKKQRESSFSDEVK